MIRTIRKAAAAVVAVGALAFAAPLSAHAYPPVSILASLVCTPGGLAIHQSCVATFTVTDQNGTPIANVTVTFSDPSFCGGPPCGTLNPTVATTDGNGQAKTTFTATRCGTEQLVASGAGVTATTNIPISGCSAALVGLPPTSAPQPGGGHALATGFGVGAGAGLLLGGGLFVSGRRRRAAPAVPTA